MKKLLVVIALLVILVKYLRKKYNRIRNAPNRLALITGAASGIGKATAFMLLDSGWKIIACDVNKSALESVGYPADSVTLVPMDVTNTDHCQQVFETIKSKGKGLDALLNIAGVVQPGPVAGFTPEQRDYIYKVNLFAPMHLCELFIPLLTQNNGSIVNLSSFVADFAMPWGGNYAPTKTALKMYTDLLRRESLANRLPIRISTVAPGHVKTPLSDIFADRLKAWARDNSGHLMHPGTNRQVEWQSMLFARGVDPDIMAVYPNDVATLICDLLDDLEPEEYVLVVEWKLKVIYYLALYLPTYWADRLTISL